LASCQKVSGLEFLSIYNILLLTKFGTVALAYNKQGPFPHPDKKENTKVQNYESGGWSDVQHVRWMGLSNVQWMFHLGDCLLAPEVGDHATIPSLES
jgi:hypothetical protein